MKKLLSISIPTYNRVFDLQVTLNNLIYQIAGKFEDLIEIIVSDNASSNNTLDMLKNFQQKYPNIFRFITNEKNLGFGKNMQVLMDNCQTEYIWFCGDDDILYDGIIEKIVNILNNNDYDNIFINYKANPEGICVDIKEDTITNNLSGFFKITNNSSCFITSNIFRADVIKKAEYHSLNWYHFAKLINFPQETKSYLISKPYITVSRPESNNWNSYKNKFLYNFEFLEAIFKSSLLQKIKLQLFGIYKLSTFHSLQKCKKHCKNEKIDYKAIQSYSYVPKWT